MLCFLLLRPTIQLLCGLLDVLNVDNVVPPLHAVGLMAADLHPNRSVDSGLSHIPSGRPAKIVKKKTGVPRPLGSGIPSPSASQRAELKFVGVPTFLPEFADSGSVRSRSRQFDGVALPANRRDLLRPSKDSRTTPLKRSEEHTSELQSLRHLVCRLLLEKK